MRTLYDGRGDEAALGRVRELDGEATDTAGLVRRHEQLLFLVAYPPSAVVKRRAERLLAGTGRRVAALRDEGADLEPLEEPEVSGVAGSGISAVFSYGVVRDLAARHGESIEIDWEFYERSHHMGRELPRFVPLLGEDAMVEAVVPYREWLRRAAGGGSVLAWLMERLSTLPPEEAARLYDSLELMLRWEFGESSATRTVGRLPGGKTYYHRGPLLGRRDVNLDLEVSGPAMETERLSRREGRRLLEMLRDTSAVRYRELHGFTFGDPARVVRVAAGRGVEIYVTVIPPGHRLPLRAYHGGMFFKNGVPIGYVEGLSLFDRMEVGFNLYYTFREGESAWLYAKTLAVFRQLLGMRYFLVDPYQIGFKNEEAIASGAFWFYRKMGFRPVRPEQARLCEREEARMARRPGYRSPPATLRRLAAGAIIYESPGASSGVWDGFEARRLGFAVQERMAQEFGGDAERMRETLLSGLEVTLDVPRADLERAPDLAVAVAVAPGLEEWTGGEKRLARRIIQAKGGPDEGRCLKLMQRHAKLRDGWIQLAPSTMLMS